MKIKVLSFLLFIFQIAFVSNSCRKEDIEITNPGNEVFNFVVTEAQRHLINSSRGEQYLVTDPLPELHFADEIYSIDKFEIRGDNTLNFQRKGFGVNMNRKLVLYNPETQTEKEYEEYKLLAMVYDYTYIENSIGTGFFKEAGLWPVYSFFTEVRLNDNTQGLYHFIEDPVEYLIENENSSFVVRRGYDHVVKACSASPDHINDIEYYIARFKRIYSLLPEYSGKQLYDSLSAYIDLEHYFTKISIDMLIRNGDYTDEIFLYSKLSDGKEIFGVFPWDFDDIFAGEPHEIGNPWAPGTVFGNREYSTMNDVTADVGNKLLFSIEDDLDYKIAKDEFLYQRYLETMRSIIVKIDLAVIDKVFDKTREKIEPFYSNDLIVSQSRYDARETNHDLFISNLAEKREMIKERRTWIMQELDKQQTGK